MTHATCRLTANNRGRLRNRTLGNRVWATFTFLIGAMSFHTVAKFIIIHAEILQLLGEVVSHAPTGSSPLNPAGDFCPQNPCTVLVETLDTRTLTILAI